MGLKKHIKAKKVKEKRVNYALSSYKLFNQSTIKELL